MKTLIYNIGLLGGILPSGIRMLRGSEMQNRYTTLSRAWLLIDGERISDYGPECGWHDDVAADRYIDACGGAVLPAWCDSHTHIVYAGSREGEFTDKIRGLSYAEIARRGGGILNSADRLHHTSEEELYEQARRRLDDMVNMGSGLIEIKSGYGLNTDDELKMLRVIRRLKQESPATIVSTFLGAHAVGRAYTGRQGEYVDMVIGEMLPAVAAEGLAEYIDVFCDEGFFTPDETRRLLMAGACYGMRGKIHASELADSGGVKVGVEQQALSVDHLESISDDDVQLLSRNKTIATVLPGTSFFLNMPYAPARRLIGAGCAVAVATDYNPGSTPSGSMPLAVSLACIKMRLLPAEALHAATINGAAAMGMSNHYGSITPGKMANVFITRPIPSIAYLPYSYSEPLIEHVILRGKTVK